MSIGLGHLPTVRREARMFLPLDLHALVSKVNLT
jgi:hypothetical protein